MPSWNTSFERGTRSDAFLNPVYDGAEQIETVERRFAAPTEEECLDRLIPFGERHFRRAVTEFVVHYHRERNHQGLGNTSIEAPLAGGATGRVHRRPRLGGLLNYYERAA